MCEKCEYYRRDSVEFVARSLAVRRLTYFTRVKSCKICCLYNIFESFTKQKVKFWRMNAEWYEAVRYYNDELNSVDDAFRLAGFVDNMCR